MNPERERRVQAAGGLPSPRSAPQAPGSTSTDWSGWRCPADPEAVLDAWPEGAATTALLLFSQGLSSGPGTQSRQSKAGRAIVTRPLPGCVTPAPLTPSRQARISGNSFGKGE